MPHSEFPPQNARPSNSVLKNRACGARVWVNELPLSLTSTLRAAAFESLFIDVRGFANVLLAPIARQRSLAAIEAETARKSGFRAHPGPILDFCQHIHPPQKSV